jgi:alcohol dehydrogenase
LKAIELAAKHLPIAYADGSNYEAREGMMMAADLAGYAENYVGTCGEHALAEATGGIYGNLVHGVLVSIYLPYMMEYNRLVDPCKFSKIANAMGENVEGLSPREASIRAIEVVRRFIEDLDVPQNLKSLGVKKVRLQEIAEKAFSNPNSPDNPRAITREGYLKIIEKAYEGE